MNYSPNNQDGHFVWHDLMTSQFDETLAFYKALFEWDHHTVHMGPEIGDYTMFRVNGRDIGGIIALKPEDQIPAHWISYISVHHIDNACTAFQANGATIHHGPFDIPGVGRTAIAEGPTGAYFSPYQDNSIFDPAEIRVPGGFIWHELMTQKAPEAISFYTALFGWDKSEMPLPDGTVYYVLSKEDQQVAGLVQMPPDARGPTHWLPYVEVMDVVATANMATAQGGKVGIPPTRLEEPAEVHFAILSAPDGSLFGILGP